MLVHICLRKAEHRAVKINIFPCRQFKIKAGAKLNQRRYNAPCHDRALCRCKYSGNDLKQGRFARAVQTDDTENVAFFNVQTDIIECNKVLKHELALYELQKIFLKALKPFLAHVEMHFYIFKFNRIIVGHRYSSVTC